MTVVQEEEGRLRGKSTLSREYNNPLSGQSLSAVVCILSLHCCIDRMLCTLELLAVCWSGTCLLCQAHTARSLPAEAGCLPGGAGQGHTGQGQVDWDTMMVMMVILRPF